MKICKKSQITLLLTYFVWSWSAMLASATWWLLTVPPLKEPEQSRNSKMVKDYCDSLRFLKAGQSEYCLNHPTLIQKISEGANAGIRECSYQFRHSRWNCSTYADVPDKYHAFKPIIKSPSRESAYVHAIIAATVTYEVTRACSVGDLPEECACAKTRKPSKFNWGGCSDDIRFGQSVSKKFLDSDTPDTNIKNRIILHNSEAGRKVVYQNQRRNCKCHGLSGACTQIVCWKTMPTLGNISRTLKIKYDGAIAVKSKRSKKLRAKIRRHKNPTANDLVYIQQSGRTNFCEANVRQGSYGTHHRLCNATSRDTDGCGIMCCDRDYRTVQVTRKTDCNCTFEWCCKLKCQTCYETVTESYCT